MNGNNELIIQKNVQNVKIGSGMLKSKIQQLRQAIKNPPPERLAAIEYRSHFLQMIGITVVCIALIVKGFWYICFALVFGLGINYSAGMTAYMKYKNILAIVKPDDPRNYELDVSPSRRRSKIIGYVMKGWAGFLSSVIAVVGSYYWLGVDRSWWLNSLSYLFAIPFVYIIVYFFGFYYLCYPIYKRRMKK